MHSCYIFVFSLIWIHFQIQRQSYRTKDADDADLEGCCREIRQCWEVDGHFEETRTKAPSSRTTEIYFWSGFDWFFFTFSFAPIHPYNVIYMFSSGLFTPDESESERENFLWCFNYFLWSPSLVYWSFLRSRSLSVGVNGPLTEKKLPTRYIPTDGMSFWWIV